LDIKLKDIKYAVGTKIAAVILICLCFISTMGSGIFLLYNGEIVRSESYYDTHSFKYEFARLIHNTVEAKIKLKGIENIKASGETQEVIENNIERFYGIEDRLSEMVNFSYYIKNSSTGKVITNITDSQPVALLEKQPFNIHVSQLKWKSKFNLPVYMGDIVKMLKDTNFEVYAAVIEPGAIFTILGFASTDTLLELIFAVPI